MRKKEEKSDFTFIIITEIVIVRCNYVSGDVSETDTYEIRIFVVVFMFQSVLQLQNYKLPFMARNRRGETQLTIQLDIMIVWNIDLITTSE